MRTARLLQTITLIATGLALSSWTGAPSPADAAGAGANITLRPSDAQGNVVSGPGYFDFTAAPGSLTTLYALVGNEGGQAGTAKVIPVDARSGVFGGISYNLPQQSRHGVGAWVKLPGSTFPLDPSKGVVVPFTVKIPAGTKPGQYVGALTAYVPISGKKKGGVGGVQVQRRVVNAIEVTVPGPLRAAFSVTGVGSQRRPDGIYILVHLLNTGNVLLKGQGYLWINDNHTNKLVMSKPIGLDTTVPKTGVDYPLYFGYRPKTGTYRYSVKLSWNGGKADTANLSWKSGKVAASGKFTIKR
jgi:hypothetical protein